jgi:hypothetical protein
VDRGFDLLVGQSFSLPPEIHEPAPHDARLQLHPANLQMSSVYAWIEASAMLVGQSFSLPLENS